MLDLSALVQETGAGKRIDIAGLGYRGDRFALDWAQIGKTILLAVFLFLFVYLSEHVLESIFIADFQFIFPFASDLCFCCTFHFS